MRKLRLFVKEHMEYWLMGLASGLLATSFGLLVKASDVSSQEHPGRIDWHVFLWCSIVALALSIIFWAWSGIIFRRKDRKRADIDAATLDKLNRDKPYPGQGQL